MSKIVAPLVESNELNLTFPEKPKSPRQKYFSNKNNIKNNAVLLPTALRYPYIHLNYPSLFCLRHPFTLPGIQCHKHNAYYPRNRVQQINAVNSREKRHYEPYPEYSENAHCEQ